jgi:hypothetical protein
MAKYWSPAGRKRGVTVRSARPDTAPSAAAVTDTGTGAPDVMAPRSSRKSTAFVPAGTVQVGPGGQSARSHSATGAPATVTVTGPVALGVSAAVTSAGALPEPSETWTSAPRPA